MRLLRAGLTLWIVISAVFILARVGGDPVQYLLPPDIAGPEREDLRRILGLDRSIFVQYLIYLENIAGGDFGRSFFSSRPVSDVFFERLPATISLMAPSLLMAVVIGVPAGVLAAVYHNTVIDRVLMALSFIGQSMPSFVLGIALILLFSLMLKILPSSGDGSWQHYIMPIATLSTILAASIARLTRGSLLDVLNRPFITFARGKGLPRFSVNITHGLRNALLPVVTLIGMQIGALIGGTAVIETVFAWPGVGRLMVDSVIRGDYALLQFGILILAGTVIICNLLVDASYLLLDPRLRSRGAA
ncbi:ABC transporter permease [Aquamicrobium defluvii]|nr:ABC transporter permease [Aquamicrobium defluvii]